MFSDRSGADLFRITEFIRCSEIEPYFHLHDISKKKTWLVFWDSFLSKALALISWYLKVDGKENTRTSWDYKVYQKTFTSPDFEKKLESLHSAN